MGDSWKERVEEWKSWSASLHIWFSLLWLVLSRTNGKGPQSSLLHLCWWRYHRLQVESLPFGDVLFSYSLVLVAERSAPVFWGGCSLSQLWRTRLPSRSRSGVTLKFWSHSSLPLIHDPCGSPMCEDLNRGGALLQLLLHRLLHFWNW